MTRSNHAEAQALREEIGQTRAELGATVQELAARADVPARVRAAYGRTSARVRRSPAPWLMLAGGGIAAVVAMVLIVRGRRA